jgi:hypothetical protein
VLQGDQEGFEGMYVDTQLARLHLTLPPLMHHNFSRFPSAGANCSTSLHVVARISHFSVFQKPVLCYGLRDKERSSHSSH